MDEHREDIEDDESIPPWERSGCFRRDCEPHRGDMLWWLGFANILLAILAQVPCCGWMPGILGISLGLCGRYMAKSDLAKMRAGRMNPYGKELTDSAMSLINKGLGFSIYGTVLWGGLVLLIRWLLGSG